MAKLDVSGMTVARLLIPRHEDKCSGTMATWVASQKNQNRLLPCDIALSAGDSGDSKGNNLNLLNAVEVNDRIKVVTTKLKAASSTARC